LCRLQQGTQSISVSGAQGIALLGM